MSVSSMPAAAVTEPQNGGKKKGGKKKLVLILVVVALLGAGAWWQFLRPQQAEAAPPEPGEVVALEPIQVNLAAEHYLRIGIALQLTADAHDADGSKALDATIDTFSGQPVAEVNNPEKRKELKQKLTKHLVELYHHEVMEVYFTEFVTQ